MATQLLALHGNCTLRGGLGTAYIHRSAIEWNRSCLFGSVKNLNSRKHLAVQVRHAPCGIRAASSWHQKRVQVETGTKISVVRGTAQEAGRGESEGLVSRWCGAVALALALAVATLGNTPRALAAPPSAPTYATAKAEDETKAVKAVARAVLDVTERDRATLASVGHLAQAARSSKAALDKARKEVKLARATDVPRERRKALESTAKRAAAKHAEAVQQLEAARARMAETAAQVQATYTQVRDLEEQLLTQAKKASLSDERELHRLADEVRMRGSPALAGASGSVQPPDSSSGKPQEVLASWLQEQQQQLKQRLETDPEVAQKYAAAKEAEVLAARDRVEATTWYDEAKGRWEMSALGATHAVNHRLVSSGELRQDSLVMWLQLKADKRTFFVDLQGYDMVDGGQSGAVGRLWSRLKATGAATSTRIAWVPFSQWAFMDLFSLPYRLLATWTTAVYNSDPVQAILPGYFKQLRELADEILLRVIVPLLPRFVKVVVGLEYAKGDYRRDVSETVAWLAQSERKLAERQGGPVLWWYLSLPLRIVVAGYPILWLYTKLRNGPINSIKMFKKRRPPGEENLPENVTFKSAVKSLRTGTLEPGGPVTRTVNTMRWVRKADKRLADIYGIDAIRSEINEVIGFLRNPKTFAALGARAPRGLLVTGSDDTRREELISAIAAEARVPVITFTGGVLLNKLVVGLSASRVRDLFKAIRELAPLIIYMNDIDMLAKVRGYEGNLDFGDQERESMLNQLLVELDGFETQDGVVVLASTRNPELLDPAIRRPGRIDRLLVLTLPNVAERFAILKREAAKKMSPELCEAVDWWAVAEAIQDTKGEDLALIPCEVQAAALWYKVAGTADGDELYYFHCWIRIFKQHLPWIFDTGLWRWMEEKLRKELDLKLEPEDMRRAQPLIDFSDTLMPGHEIRDPGHPWTREFKYPHAVWAAARGVVAALMPNFETVQVIWLARYSYEGVGYVKLSEKEPGFTEAGLVERLYSEKWLVMLCSSAAAASMLLPWGEGNNLATMQLRKARLLARKMVLQQGWDPDGSPIVYQTPMSVGPLPLGHQQEELMRQRVDKLFTAAWDMAAKILEENRATLEACVEALIEHDAVNTEGLERIVNETGGQRIPEPFQLFPQAEAGPGRPLLESSLAGATL